MTPAPPTPTAALEPAFLTAFRTGTLTESQASEFARRDPLVIQFSQLQLSLAIAGTPAPGAHCGRWACGRSC